MARAGRKLPEEYIKNMIKEGDVLKNNRINFDEFLLLMDQDHKNKSFHSNGSFNDLTSLLSSPPKNSKLFKMELSEQDWKKI
jgi:hypothetical protein